MLRKIEHLGIAVKSIDDSLKTFETLLGSNCYKIEDVVSEGVKTAFIQVGESKIELLEATNPDSPIAKYLDKKGPGIHHIAFDVQDIHSEMKRLQALREKAAAAAAAAETVLVSAATSSAKCSRRASSPPI